MGAKVKKVRKNFLIPVELADWLDSYTKTNNVTMTQIIVDHLTSLKKQLEGGNVSQI